MASYEQKQKEALHNVVFEAKDNTKTFSKKIKKHCKDIIQDMRDATRDMYERGGAKDAGGAIAHNLVDYFDNVSLAVYDEAEYAEIDVYELWQQFDKIAKKDKNIIRLNWREFERNTWPYIENFMEQFVYDAFYLEGTFSEYDDEWDLNEKDLYEILLDKLEPRR